MEEHARGVSCAYVEELSLLDACPVRDSVLWVVPCREGASSRQICAETLMLAWLRNKFNFYSSLVAKEPLQANTSEGLLLEPLPTGVDILNWITVISDAIFMISCSDVLLITRTDLSQAL